MSLIAQSAVELPTRLPARLKANITELRARRHESLILTEIGRSGFFRKSDPNELALRDELLREAGQSEARVLMLNGGADIHETGWTTFFVISAAGMTTTILRHIDSASSHMLVAAADESTSGTIVLDGKTMQVTGFLRAHLDRDTVTLGIQLFDENHKPVVMTSVIAAIDGVATEIPVAAPAPALSESPVWSPVRIAA